MIPKIQSAHGSETRNIINSTIDAINVQGKSIQDLVAEGQLTPAQYAQLISIINGNIKSGAITIDDVDKNNFRIDQTMITDDLRRIITGNTPINAVPADDSLNTAKYKNDSVTRNKRTVGGERASTLTWNKLPNIDLINKKVEFYPQTEIVHSKGRTVLSDKIELDLIPSKSLSIITFNTLNDTLNVIDASGINNMTEYEVFVMRVSFVDGVAKDEILDVVCDSDYTVNGKKRVATESVHNNSLSQELSNQIFSNKSYINEFKLGQINVATGSYVNSDVLIITELITVTKDSIIQMDESQIYRGFRVFYYDMEGNFLRYTPFYKRHDITEDSRVILQTGYEDSRIINTLEDFKNKITITRSRLNDEEKKVIYEGVYNVRGFEFGELAIANGNHYSSNKRNVRTDFMKLRRGYKVKMNRTNDSPGVTLFKYDLDFNYLGYESAGFEHIITEDMYVRLQSRHQDNREIESIDFFSNNIYVDMNVSLPSIKPRQLFGDFNKIYQTDPLSETNFIASSKFQDVYDKYDELMAQHNEIMTKELLGYGTNSSGGEDESLPIFEYSIANPTNPVIGNLPNISPTIMIVCVIHGSEKTPPWATYYFIEQLLNKWDENDVLGAIKSNVNFKMIPVANPGGYNDATYHNRNDVNLNRNFGHNWGSSDGDLNVIGKSAYSEHEAKALKNWLDNNVGDNNIFIDFHNTGEQYGLTYLVAKEEQLINGYSSIARRLSDLWKKRYAKSIDTNTYGRIINNNYATIYNDAYYNYEIKSSALLEIAWDFDGVYHTPETFERGVDLLANYIQLTLRLYNSGEL